MSFRVNNSNKNIYYYTVILEKDQIKENKEDSPTIIIKPKQRPKSLLKRTFEKIVYEQGEWKIVSTYE